MTLSVLLNFLCLAANNNDGPPGFYYEKKAYMALYPINRIICPHIDTKRDIIFELFTSANPETSQILELGNDNSVFESNLDFQKPTIIYFHGFLEGATYGSAKIIRDAYMKRGGHNIIVVNAQRLVAGPWYYTAAKNTKVIGRYTATFIDYLVTKGLQLDTIHIIGHSLGGQMAGVCGLNVKSGKVPRITGLDPAKPLFAHARSDVKLDKQDAEFVDVIHTTTNYGLFQPLGHADFYPNGGKQTQPGCSFRDIYRRGSISTLELIFCSHWRSVFFYAESVSNPNSFLSVNANSWNDYKAGRYIDGPVSKSFMGFGASKDARGLYFLHTNAESPYSKAADLERSSTNLENSNSSAYSQQTYEENRISNEKSNSNFENSKSSKDSQQSYEENWRTNTFNQNDS